MPATFAGTQGDLRAGPHRVTYNGRDLGFTVGGIQLNVEWTGIDQKVDQFPVPIGKFMQAGRVSGSFTLSEWDNDNLRILWPDSTHFSTAGESVHYPTSHPGEISHTGLVLVFHPMRLVDGDTTEDIRMSNALLTPGGAITFGPDQMLGLSVNYEAFADPNNDGVAIIVGEIAASGAGS